MMMKVILSRKGFDSNTGGYPSPVLPNGLLLSLPIPQPNNPHCYSDLKFDNKYTYYDLMHKLFPNTCYKYQNQGMRKSEWYPLGVNTECHLDPDIYPSIIERPKGWKPLFGQGGIAQKHLSNQQVGVGDLFLFFGWFRNTVRSLNGFTYNESDPGRHIIYGYLQIDNLVKISMTTRLPDWMCYHPHSPQSCKDPTEMSPENTIYIAKETLSWNNKLPGAGFFPFDSRLVLTKPGSKRRSVWKLPPFFKEVNISYNRNAWHGDDFYSCARGQEFVIGENVKIEAWAKELINDNITFLQN
jgi:hypothetical protein